MIKLKDILLENDAPNIFVPRRTDDRLERYVKQFVKKGCIGNLILTSKGLKVLPKILKGVTIYGYFSCYFNELTTLENSPAEAYGFFCDNNKLVSLEGGPKIVRGSFNCGNNNLVSLEGGPKIVTDNYICSNNKLTSLKGAPESVLNFDCINNQLTSLEGIPKVINGSILLQKNPGDFTIEQVRKMSNVKKNVYLGL